MADPVDISKLSPEEQAELEALLRAQYPDEGLADFISRVWPRQAPPPHLLPLIELIERARRERIFAWVSKPPRHGKSITIQRGIAWWLKSAPADTCALVGYSDSFAWAQSRKARRAAFDAGIKLSGDAKTVREWRTAQGGGVLAAGAKGGLTGQGVSGLMVVDDPYKGREQADSEAHREAVWDWFTETVFTRLERASVIVVHTRWREDDLIGRLRAEHGWEGINLPAIAEEDDPAGRAPGEALWPERYPIEELEKIRGILGPWAFSALYQGRPRRKGAAVFGEPHYYDPLKVDLTGCRVVIGGDPAASEKTTADYGVLLCLAVRGEGDQAVGYVVEVDRRQVEVPAYVAAARAMSARRWHAPLAVEAVGGFKAVPQMLKQIDPKLRLLEVKLGGDKFQRAQPVAAAWNAGRVLVPQSAPWLKDFLAEVRSFTGVNDDHDDQVDSLAHAWNAINTAAKEPQRGSRLDAGRWR